MATYTRGTLKIPSCRSKLQRSQKNLIFEHSLANHYFHKILKMKHLFTLLISITLSSSILAQVLGWENKVDELLLNEATSGQKVDFIVEMQDVANLGAAQMIHGKTAKATFVYQQLSQTVDRSQEALRAYLDAHQLPYRAYHVVNAIYVRADIQELATIASRLDVKHIHYNLSSKAPLPTPEVNPKGMLVWGVPYIRANQVWTMGYNGQGVTIGGQDTGYDWTHPALQAAYRGWDGVNADHNYNWHDAIHTLNPLNGDTTANPFNNPCGLDAPAPCDDGSHGTHTMGTMVGFDTSQMLHTGVAPGARWIGCRNMDRGWGLLTTYIECFEWFLAPTDTAGNNPDPSKAPHVINNSWYCAGVEGCNAGNWALMETAVNNLRAAGVVVVVSAGNSGPGCSTIQDPAGMFEGSFSVGASDYLGNIAGFSSRGPVAVDGSMRMKPNVSAPGVNVYSSFPNNNYGFNSGTSMAGPHVAGLVALVISANPDLAGEVEAIENIIEQTATPAFDTVACGGVPGNNHPNNTFGWGIVDAVNAVNMALQYVPVIEPIAETTPIRVAPNPFNETLTVFTGTALPQDLEVWDMWGRLVLREMNISNYIVLDGAAWPAGMYVCKIGGRTVKVVKR